MPNLRVSGWVKYIQATCRIPLLMRCYGHTNTWAGDSGWNFHASFCPKFVTAGLLLPRGLLQAKHEPWHAGSSLKEVRFKPERARSHARTHWHGSHAWTPELLRQDLTEPQTRRHEPNRLGTPSTAIPHHKRGQLDRFVQSARIPPWLQAWIA